jgi:HK97 gp10 family phage protein
VANNTSFQVSGFAELFKHMDELKEEIGKGKTDRIWRSSLLYAFIPVLETAKSNAPVDSGQLREHLYIKASRPTSRDKAGKYYDGEQWMVRVSLNPKREDSVQNVVLNKKGKFQNRYTNRPVGLAEEFGTANNGGGKPFLRPALETNASRVIERLGSKLWSNLNSGKFTNWGK